MEIVSKMFRVDFKIELKKTENKKILKSYLLKKKKSLDGWDTMSLGLNNSKYSVTGVNIDATGNRIFFSSNRPNGFGSSDLYTADIKEIDYNDKVPNSI